MKDAQHHRMQAGIEMDDLVRRSARYCVVDQVKSTTRNPSELKPLADVAAMFTEYRLFGQACKTEGTLIIQNGASGEAG